jgi:threonylcarbamoyladenosine tRNA methylthiotransferase MtaB
MQNLKIGFKTLGCRLNQFETDALSSQLQKQGYTTSNNLNSDITVINTCTVTNQSDKKSSYEINKAIRANPDSFVIITGCMADQFKTQLQSQFPQAYILNNHQKSGIPSVINAYANGELLSENKVPQGSFNYEPANKTFHTRSMIKIQDGCNNHCTFCIIPQVRGRAISRPCIDILDNAKQLLDFGYKELVLTGVNISRYDAKGTSFSGLLNKILNLPGDFRVRLSSLEPDNFDPAFFDLLNHPKMTPHLHLCLQSGSDKTLLQMRRMYTQKTYSNLVERIRKTDPLFNITTDVIVGFPGEDETDFKQTLEFSRQMAFGHIHVFKYSIRTNTRAERLPGQLPEHCKTERSMALRQLSEELSLAYRKKLINIPQQLLVESISNNKTIKGYGEYYVPIAFKQPKAIKNTFLRVTPDALSEKGYLTQK